MEEWIVDNKQKMFNQVNALLTFLAEDDRKKLPQKLIDFFKEHANQPPTESLDISLPLAEQDLTDETLLMLYYINDILKKAKQK